jgi:hypothetical protein
MSRKVFVNVTTRLIFDMEEGIEVDDVIQEMDYDFKSNTTGATIMDTEIRDHEVVDSK